MSVLIHNNVKYHQEQVEKFFSDSKDEYNVIKYIAPNEDSLEQEARSEAV